jgi:hypothetical protein
MGHLGSGPCMYVRDAIGPVMFTPFTESSYLPMRCHDSYDHLHVRLPLRSGSRDKTWLVHCSLRPHYLRQEMDICPCEHGKFPIIILFRATTNCKAQCFDIIAFITCSMRLLRNIRAEKGLVLAMRVTVLAHPNSVIQYIRSFCIPAVRVGYTALADSSDAHILPAAAFSTSWLLWSAMLSIFRSSSTR